ncbi:hypothetical protein NM688_g4911 [Phlebia brevispora]|uniref:Uncharacterized protein n=1 Tax=Phlebia brevispora TaxID=194682 RepID=A0ACC1T258_9APHY|nr:hypothetical protein NM688_g4911 [Phlebia brevispora]
MHRTGICHRPARPFTASSRSEYRVNDYARRRSSSWRNSSAATSCPATTHPRPLNYSTSFLVETENVQFIEAVETQLLAIAHEGGSMKCSPALLWMQLEPHVLKICVSNQMSQPKNLCGDAGWIRKSDANFYLDVRAASRTQDRILRDAVFGRISQLLNRVYQLSNFRTLVFLDGSPRTQCVDPAYIARRIIALRHTVLAELKGMETLILPEPLARQLLLEATEGQESASPLFPSLRSVSLLKLPNHPLPGPLLNELGRALQMKLDFAGAVSFHRVYPNAPNPCLVLSDLGTVGLPLSSRDAEAIKSRAEQAPFGIGERTVVDKSVRDTWQMSPDMVKFANLAWEIWLKSVVHDICKTLGVVEATSRPRWELHKLLLYETGSHFLPHVDTEKGDGMFATIVIALPSQFTGGATHVTHGGMSAAYDCSTTSDVQTSVMAWYIDVTHEVKPITSGYRLALSLNLIHTTTALRPAPSGNKKVLAALRKVLLAWRADAGLCTPDKILYLLEHKYSQANLRGSALKGSDAQRVALLHMLGKELGFCLGLATVECHAYGTADCEEPASDDWASHSRACSPDVGFEEIDIDVTITNFVDLESTPITGNLVLHDAMETIPGGDNYEFEEAFPKGPHYKQEFEGYTGNESATLERWYRRTVLVIWPKYANGAVTNSVDSTYNDLYTDIGRLDTATEEVRGLIDYVLNRSDPSKLNGEHLPELICGAAYRWGDVGLWRHAVDACAEKLGLATLDIGSLSAAAKQFGFEEVRPRAQIQRETNNKEVFTFFDQLRALDWNGDSKKQTRTTRQSRKKTRASKSRNHSTPEAVVTEWIELQRTAAKAALRKLRPDDFEMLMGFAQEHGLVYIRDDILPQIVSSADPSLLRELAVYVANEKDFAPESDHEVRHDVFSRILKAAVSRFSLAPATQPTRSYHQFEPKTTESGLKLALETVKSYFDSCFALQCPDLAGALIGTVAHYSEEQTWSDSTLCVQTLTVPFLEYVQDYLATHPGAVGTPEFSRLQIATIVPTVNTIVAYPQFATREELRRLLRTEILSEDKSVFETYLLPHIDTLASWSKTALILAEELHSNSEFVTFPAEHKGPRLPEILILLTREHARHCDTTSCEAIISAISVCIRMKALVEIGTVMDRVLHVNNLRIQGYRWRGAATYADDVILPLPGRLRQLALKHDVLDAMSPAFRSIARTWIHNFLPTAVAEPTARINAIRAWQCDCQSCRFVRAFLLSDPDQSRECRKIGAQDIKHVEAYLRQFVTSEGATWHITHTIPEGLRITKTKLLHDCTVWKVGKTKAIKLLHDISPDEEERRRILGDEYAELVRRVEGAPAPAAAAPQVPPVAETPRDRAQGTIDNGPRRLTNARIGARPTKRAKTSRR